MVSARIVALGLCILCNGLSHMGAEVRAGVNEYSRHDFPPDFIFGAATSAYQVEGAALDDGRKPSIFDTFAHSGSVEGNADVSCDEYHRYKEDVQLMAETGLDAYRFSISWSRLIPDGRGAINPKGLQYYNNLINELVKYGIESHVTLVHSDVPQVLEDEYNGCLSRQFIEDFTAYADVCFREFGDRVLHWTTFNEVNIFVLGGYDAGNTPPGRCSSPFGFNCSAGDSTTEPYLAAHHILLAHASAANLYKLKYQALQHGFVGFNLFAYHIIPLTDTSDDILAARKCYDFWIGWFMHPLTYGDYPDIMKTNVGIRLPAFNKRESSLVQGSFDFIGINYYNILKIESSSLKTEPRDCLPRLDATWAGSGVLNKVQGWDPIAPFPNTFWGLKGVLEHFKQVYNNPTIFIHENGQITNTTIHDQVRVDYLHDHIGGLLDAVRNGSNAKGYFVWSFLDVYELLFGYHYSFGLYYVDFDDSRLTRYPKVSQRWYSSFLKGGNISLHISRSQSDYVKSMR